MSDDRRDHFETTRWSLVLAAGGSDSAAARQALATLCETYWRPIYLYTRKSGYSAEDAQDLTQAFLALLLERHDFEHVRRERGRLRAFLLASLRHFLMNDAVHRHALKRGGGGALLSLDFQNVEAQYIRAPVDRRTPETLFERQWALDLVNQVRRRLRTEWQAAGKAEEFEILKGCLEEKLPRGGYQPLAARLGCTENAVRIAAHRLRKRFREELRATIADTLPPAEANDERAIDDELRHIFQALRN